MELSFWSKLHILKETGISKETAKNLGYWTEADEIRLALMQELDAKFEDELITFNEYREELGKL